MLPKICLIFAILHIFAPSHARVVLSLYEELQHAGSHVLFVDSAPDLSVVSSGFDNVASSACVRFSTWILYENPDYNAEVSGSLGIVYGEIVCENLPSELDNIISSVRHVGYNLSWYEDAINFYETSKFEGNELLVLEDSPNLQTGIDNRQSLIVSGRGQWTIYEQENYQGSSVCVGPQDPESGVPGIYGDFSATTGWIPTSAQKGCFAQTSIKPLHNQKNILLL